MATVKDTDQSGTDSRLNFGDTVLLCVRMEGDSDMMKEDDKYLYRTDSNRLKLHPGTTNLPTIRSSTFKIVSVNDIREDSAVCIGDELQLEHFTTKDLIAIDNSQNSSFNYRDSTSEPLVCLKDQSDNSSTFRIVSHFRDQSEGDEVHYRKPVTLETIESDRSTDENSSLTVEFHEPNDLLSSQSDSRSSDDVITVSYQTKEKSSSSSSLDWLHNSGKVYVSSHAIKLSPGPTCNSNTSIETSEPDKMEHVHQNDEEDHSISIASDENSLENMFTKLEPNSIFNPSTETLRSESLDQEQSQVLDEEQASNTSDCGENFADASKDAEANKSLDVDYPLALDTQPQQPSSPPVAADIDIEHPKHDRKPQEYITQIKRHVDLRLKVKVPKVKLIESLQPILQILNELQAELSTVSTDPWVQEFIDTPNNGHDALIDLIRDLIDDPAPVERKNKRRYSVLERTAESLDAALLCLKSLIKHENAMTVILKSYFSSHVLAQCLYLRTASCGAKKLALEMLATFLQAEEAQGKVIEAFDHFRMERKERMRFESLMDSLQYGIQPSEPSYQVAILHFINALVRTAQGFSEKCFYQQQFLEAGFRPKDIENSLNDQGLEEIEEWHRSYVDVQQCVDDLEKYKSENEQISIELLLAKKQLEEATNRCDKLEKDIAHLHGKDKILRDELRRAQQYLHKAKLDREFLRDQTKELMLKADYQNPDDLRSSPRPWEHMRH